MDSTALSTRLSFCPWMTPDGMVGLRPLKWSEPSIITGRLSCLRRKLCSVRGTLSVKIPSQSMSFTTSSISSGVQPEAYIPPMIEPMLVLTMRSGAM